MAVHLTRIYTKTGDAGRPHLGDMSRVPKTDPRLVAYADVDEANARSASRSRWAPPEPTVADLLRSVQNDLFDVGADLCTPVDARPGVPAAAGHRGVHRAARGWLRRVQRARCRSWTQLHPARRHRRRGAAAPGADGRPARRAQRLGAARPSTPSAPTPRRPATSTGSPTCCSSSPGPPTRAATCCGCRARTAAPTPSASG